MFDEYEIECLMRCIEDKVHPSTHHELDYIIGGYLERPPVELYRGISKTQLADIQQMGIGDVYSVERVQSFTPDFATARSFANSSVYGTKTIFSVRNAPRAFNYQAAMEYLLTLDIEDSIIKDWCKRRRDDVGFLISDEREWMFPMFTNFRIMDIDTLQYDPNAAEYTIYHMDIDYELD